MVKLLTFALLCLSNNNALQLQRIDFEELGDRFKNIAFVALNKNNDEERPKQL